MIQSVSFPYFALGNGNFGWLNCLRRGKAQICVGKRSADAGLAHTLTLEPFSWSEKGKKDFFLVVDGEFWYLPCNSMVLTSSCVICRISWRDVALLGCWNHLWASPRATSLPVCASSPWSYFAQHSCILMNLHLGLCFRSSFYTYL